MLPTNHGHEFVDKGLGLIRPEPVVPGDEVERGRDKGDEGEADSDGEGPHERLLHQEPEEVGALVVSHLKKDFKCWRFLV